VALSAREAEVLAAVARSLTNAEIAEELFISVRTVESHVSALLRKTGAADRRELAVRARAEDPPRRPTGSDELFGRDTELHRLQEALRQPGVVTVTGPGGVGKTSLVRALGGVVLVDLTALPAGSDAELVAAESLRALGSTAEGGRATVPALVAEVLARNALLALDNCEHVLEGAAQVALALTSRPGVRVLTTSRERLAVPGERVLTLGPLDPMAAEALFARRAAALSPPVEVEDHLLPEVRAICARVDCVPLAVELAAARLAQLSVRDLHQAVEAGVDVLDGGARSAARHRSVRAMLAWSCRLLAAPDERVHRWLSVLPGPFTVATATAVAGAGITCAPHVARLVECSLLVRVGDDRYRQLDLVRSDAASRLHESGEKAAAEEALLSWAETVLADDPGPDTEDDPDLRAAMVVAGERVGDRPAAILRAAARLWTRRAAWQDAIATWERAAGASGDGHDALSAAELAWARWQGDLAARMYAVAADLAEDAGDSRVLIQALEGRIELGSRFAATMDQPPGLDELRALQSRVNGVDTQGDLVSESLQAMASAWVEAEAGDQSAALELARRAAALAEAVSDPVLTSAALDAEAGAAAALGDAAALHAVGEQRFALLDGLGRDPRGDVEVSDVLTMSVDGPLAVGRFTTALERSRRLLDREAGRGLAHVGLGRMLVCEFFLGRFPDVLRHGAAMVKSWEDSGAGVAGYLVPPVAVCAAVHGYRGDDQAQQRWLDLLDRVSPGTGARASHPLVLALGADVHLFRGRRDLATQMVEEAAWDVVGARRSLAAVEVTGPGLYAATRAEILGEPGYADAEALERGNRYARGILARARGDLDGALGLFDECAASFQVVRTRLAMTPGDVTVRHELKTLVHAIDG
jgi:predicted ATPase/DNA-binding CsgD family transcriptional regulator